MESWQPQREGQNNLGFWIMPKSDTVKIHREFRVYDEIGLIGSIGGSLGLFVGFSFYDLICYAVDAIKNRIRMKTESSNEQYEL